MAKPSNPVDALEQPVVLLRETVTEWTRQLEDENLMDNIREAASIEKAISRIIDKVDGHTCEALISARMEWQARHPELGFGEVTPEMDEAVEKIKTVLEVQQFGVEIPDADKYEALVVAFLEVAAQCESLRGAKARSGTKGIRGIGVGLSVTCDCGEFVRNSTNGDWTSIRYQAKVHAEECAIANPSDEDYINNLDLVREAIVNEGLASHKSGGMVFEREGGKPTVASVERLLDRAVEHENRDAVSV